MAKTSEAKFDTKLANEAVEWLRGVLEFADKGAEAEKLHAVVGEADLSGMLRDGVILCEVANDVKAGSVKKILKPKMDFEMGLNIQSFLSAAERLGAQKDHLFQTQDLLESDNMVQVVEGIFEFARVAKVIGYDGPVLGPTDTSGERTADDIMRSGIGLGLAEVPRAPALPGATPAALGGVSLAFALLGALLLSRTCLRRSARPRAAQELADEAPAAE